MTVAFGDVMNHSNAEDAATGVVENSNGEESLAQQLGSSAEFKYTMMYLSGGDESSTDDEDVIVLTDATFDETVYDSEDIWMVEFYNPQCDHCEALQPEWNEAAKQLKGKVKFAKVDTTENEALTERMEITACPAIYFWNYGDGKTNSQKKLYEGAHEAQGLIDFASDLYENSTIEDSGEEEKLGQNYNVNTILANLADNSFAW